MADTTRASSPPRGGGKGEQKFLGQPTWVWLVGAGALVLGYFYFKSKSAQQPAKGQGKGQGKGGGQGGGGGWGGGYGSPAPWTSETFKTWHRQHAGHQGKR